MKNDERVQGQTTATASASFRKQSLGNLSFRLAHLFERRLDQRLALHGVNIGQFRVMFVLWEMGEATQTDIARHLGVAQPTIAKTLERMVRDNLVEMRPDPNHGRRVLASLTKNALDLRVPLLNEAGAVNDLSTKGMTAIEKDDARRFFLRFIQALETN